MTTRLGRLGSRFWARFPPAGAHVQNADWSRVYGSMVDLRGPLLVWKSYDVWLCCLVMSYLWSASNLSEAAAGEIKQNPASYMSCMLDDGCLPAGTAAGLDPTVWTGCSDVSSHVQTGEEAISHVASSTVCTCKLSSEESLTAVSFKFAALQPGSTSLLDQVPYKQHAAWVQA